MAELAAVLGAIAQLLWAVIGGAALWTFRQEIRSLFRRLRRVKIGSIETELDQLKENVEKATKEIPAAVGPELSTLPHLRAAELEQHTKFEGSLTSSPKLSVVLVASAIERELRGFMAATGRLKGRRLLPLNQELENLELPRSLITAIRQFQTVRNRVVHGYAATDDEAVRALDAGLSMLSALRFLPREINVVYHAGVELFADKNGMQPIGDVRGVVLETTSGDGAAKLLRVFPTTRKDYVKGRQVAWEWNPGRQWGQAWYRDPDTREIKYAWTESMEFVGRHLDEI